MSVRALGVHIIRHGTNCLRNICRRSYNTSTIADKVNVARQTVAAPSQVSNAQAQAIPRNFALRNVGVQVGLHARRILIDNVLNRVTNSLASELRKKAAKRILFGDSGPFFALVGVSLASGTGILTKEEELEGVCWEIREAISKIKWNYEEVAIDEKYFEEKPIALNDLSLGKPIAKGANAVVYASRIKNSDSDGEKDLTENKKEDPFIKYPLALKMMFNYDIQSNAMAILKAMYCETVPARMYYSHVGINDWEIDLSNRKKHLPPHPNVVAMFSVFTDYVPELQGARGLYPAALPPRIYPDGEGRNMSLFLLMKRYHCNLHDYITSNPSLPIRTSLLLLTQLFEGVAHLAAHGIAHRDLKADNLLLDMSEPEAPILVISDFGCCLADKNNGLLLPYNSYEIDKGGNAALMAPEIINQQPGTFSVLNYNKSDLWAAATIAYEIFGGTNPFYDSANWKKLKNTNYKEHELPELPEKVPNIIQSLIKNILQRYPNKRLDPEVTANVCQLLLWAPSSWLKTEVSKLPSSAEILQWLLCMTTKVLCEGRLSCTVNSVESIPSDSETGQANALVGFHNENTNKVGRRTYPEYLLIASFLCRAKLANIRAALTWIHNNV